MKKRSNKITFNYIDYGFFGRKNGKSSFAYSSLNCSKFVGDDESLVQQNLDIVRRDLAADRLVTLNQVHSNLCIIVDEGTHSDQKADALVTRTPNIAIGVLTADCAPILFCDPQNRVIGAAHAGWRGAVGGIIESTVQKMVELGSDPKKIIAVIGPCIAKESYEVDNDFRQNFESNEDCFCTVNCHPHFDLPEYCRNRLLKSGVSENDILGIDTYANNDDYFSYRFANQNSNGVCGRNISVIFLKE
ncbi:MAG: peptidoglycan editing factor PgeF [Holosporaceae bacterium]|nr:peptidoglycan editing factor PgeF [Holosporaceae bacterium]